MQVRLFAAAAEAVGSPELALDASAAPTVADLRASLAAHGDEAARVIAQCAVLRAGERLSDTVSLHSDDLVDVLPPFAGG